MNPSTPTEPDRKAGRRPVKALSIEQVAQRLSCSVDDVWNLILDFRLDTVHGIAWAGPAEVTTAELRRYLREEEQRRLREERWARAKFEGIPDPLAVVQQANPSAGQVNTLSIAQICEHTGWCAQHVKDLIYSYRLRTVRPLSRNFEPRVYASELHRYMEGRRLRAKCKENRRSRAIEKATRDSEIVQEPSSGTGEGVEWPCQEADPRLTLCTYAGPRSDGPKGG